MFIGSLNSVMRKYLGSKSGVFEGRNVVVGCSGNFAIEYILSRTAKPAAIHSNDSLLYSCQLGRWLAGQPVEFEVIDDELKFVEGYWEDDESKLATLLICLDMLAYHDGSSTHSRRMWEGYLATFPQLLEKARGELVGRRFKIDSFQPGDTLEHFQSFEGESPLFVCYAPASGGGFDKAYKKMDKMFTWDAPARPTVDEKRRGDLVKWLPGNDYLWFSEEEIDGLPLVMEQVKHSGKNIYLYSNVLTETTVFGPAKKGPAPAYPLATQSLVITEKSKIELCRIKTSELAFMKDLFLGKNIRHSEGSWAFAVVVDGVAVGFIEFAQVRNLGTDSVSSIYMQGDFAVPLTTYKRMSRLVVMMALSGETRKLVERLRQVRTTNIATTAFTNRPSSMKYRGLLDVSNRNATDDGQKFINYSGDFNKMTWQETLKKWLKKHGSGK